jgi:hypothetical protein
MQRKRASEGKKGEEGQAESEKAGKKGRRPVEPAVGGLGSGTVGRISQRRGFLGQRDGCLAMVTLPLGAALGQEGSGLS